jgi:hypothetical protein
MSSYLEKQINIVTNTKEASDNLTSVINQLEELNKNLIDINKTGSKSLNSIDKSVKNTEKSTKSLADGFKGAGLALKAMGVGLIISLLVTLKEVFSSNQKVTDFFNTSLGTLVSLFSQATTVIVGVIEKVSESSNGFQGLTKTVKGLITIGLTPLKLTFNAIKLAIQETRLAWEQSFFGDNDPTTVKNLNKSISETKRNIIEVGSNAKKAGKDVVENVGKAINEVSSVVVEASKGISKISIESTIAQAKRNVQLQNSAKLAEAQQQKLVEQYDRQAEKLRQIRDDERNSITDRIKANNDLEKVLSKQEKSMLATADAQIASAQAILKENDSIENRVALIKAQANREGVLAQIEGFRSEQKANDLSLDKESISLTKTKQETETELAINQQKFNADRIKDEEEKLLAQKTALEEELS